MRARRTALVLLACMAVAVVAATPSQARWTIGTQGDALGADAHETVEIDKATGNSP